MALAKGWKKKSSLEKDVAMKEDGMLGTPNTADPLDPKHHFKKVNNKYYAYTLSCQYNFCGCLC
jgi:hypothetical protein